MPTTRRQFVKVLGMTSLAGSTISLASCQENWDEMAAQLDSSTTDDFRPSAASSVDEITHVLNRLSFGSRPGDYRRVEEMGVDAYIEEQLDPQSIPESRRADWKLRTIESLNAPRAELFSQDARWLLADMTRAKILRAVYSRRQLHEVMVDFWTDHLNIVTAKGQCRWLKAADDRDVIRRHAMGKFPELLRASALSPAMLIYLDGHNNVVREPGDRPNENYARELLELHTLGVDGGYTQLDVMEVARCLSGWTYGHSFLHPDTVRFVAEDHDDGEKLVLGERIKAGGGQQDLEDVVRIVCGHPSTARHIARRLCRRFVADDPVADLVEDVAGTFAATDGDIKATLRTLLRSPQFRSTRGNLFKRPLRYVVSALRATDANTDGGRPLQQLLERMGHAPFQYPTPDGYPMEAEPWLGTLLWRWNFAVRLEAGRVNGTSIDMDTWKQRFGSPEAELTHFLGRQPTELELQVVLQSTHPLAVGLAGPAFQRF